ncbi:MAG: hypothetical protein AAF183_16560 [Pseudomonadota bacterium]
MLMPRLEPVRVTEPAELPVTVAELKLPLGLDHTADFDVYLGQLIGTAVEHLDGWRGILGRAILLQRWSQSYSRWERIMRLPMPADRLVSASYRNSDDVEQAFDHSQLLLHSASGASWVEAGAEVSLPATFDREDAVTLTFEAGAANAGAVPDRIKVSIIRMAMELYHDAGSSGDEALKRGTGIVSNLRNRR